MKVLSLPDVHGNPTPLKVAKQFEKEVDLLIFHGDYVDSEDNNWLTQKRCLEEILNFKHSNNKTITLIGNHDLSYLTKWGANPRVSGHQIFLAQDIQEFLSNHFEEFEPLKVVDGWIFSHAGVSRTWLKNHKTTSWEKPKEGKEWSLEDVIKIFKSKQLQYFNHNCFDPYGDDEDAGCLWIRPNALINYGIDGYNQVVGHTAIEDDLIKNDGEDYWGLRSRIMTYNELPLYKTYEKNPHKNTTSKYVFIDSLEQNHYAIINTITNEVIEGKV